MGLKKPLQLLHVDDSAIFRKTIHRGLEAFKDHYEVTQASSVDETLNLLTSSGKQFDLILTDWLMSGKSGFDLLRALKAHPAYHHLPVFFLTSEYDSSNLISVVTYGAAGILKKPITGPEVHAYLQKRMSFIEDAHTSKEDFFITEAKSLLSNISQILPLKGLQDLTICSQLLQDLKSKAMAAKWPLLAEYCQQIENVIQTTIKKEIELPTPLSGLIQEFHLFLNLSLAEIENGKPHPFISSEADKNLKNYLTGLEAGWFANRNSNKSDDGVLLPWDVINELRQHLSPAGLALLEKHINTHKKAA